MLMEHSETLESYKDTISIIRYIGYRGIIRIIHLLCDDVSDGTGCISR